MSEIRLWVKKQVNGIAYENPIPINVKKSDVVYEIIDKALRKFSSIVAEGDVSVTIGGARQRNDVLLSNIEELKDGTTVVLCWDEMKPKQNVTPVENRDSNKPKEVKQDDKYNDEQDGIEKGKQDFKKQESGNKDNKETEDLPRFKDFQSIIALEQTYNMANLPVEIQKKMDDVSIIIQACNKNELQACAEEMDGKLIPVTYDDQDAMLLYLGTFAKCPCAIVVTEQGRRCKKYLEKIIAVCTKASLIIGIGVAGAIGKAKFGDVLVATSIAHYDEGKVTNEKIIGRGPTIDVTTKIKNLFSSHRLNDWVFECSQHGRKSQVIPGLIASGPYLVDSSIWANGIKADRTETQGIEMEGHILQEIAEEKKNINVVIIKGVSDYAGTQGKKSDEWQYTAAKAAANYVKTRLMMNNFYDIVVNDQGNYAYDLQPANGIPLTQNKGSNIELNLMTLLHFNCKSTKKAIKIIQRVGRHYTQLGTFLLNDQDGSIVKALDEEHSRNAERINMEIFKKWLAGSGQPVTWPTLIENLQKVGLNELAKEISSEINARAECKSY